MFDETLDGIRAHQRMKNARIAYELRILSVEYAQIVCSGYNRPENCSTDLWSKFMSFKIGLPCSICP